MVVSKSGTTQKTQRLPFGSEVQQGIAGAAISAIGVATQRNQLRLTGGTLVEALDLGTHLHAAIGFLWAIAKEVQDQRIVVAVAAVMELSIHERMPKIGYLGDTHLITVISKDNWDTVQVKALDLSKLTYSFSEEFDVVTLERLFPQ